MATIVPPPVESLMHAKYVATYWPKIKNSEKLMREVRLRKVAYACLDFIFTRIPYAEMDIGKAIDVGLLTEQNAAVTYNSLSLLLEDPTYDRLILYFPFELIPDHAWKPASETLTTSARRFTQFYKESWYRLLSLRDVRANFVDGDIPEEEIRSSPLPRVVKAAHLLPALVKKGLVSLSEIKQLIDDNPGSTLYESITEALFVLADTGFVNIDEAKKDEPAPLPTEITRNWLYELPRYIEEGIAYAMRTAPAHLPPARERWLVKEYERRVIEKYAAEIASALVVNSLVPIDVQEFINSPKGNRLSKLIGVNAIRIAIENTARVNKVAARIMQSTCQPLIENLWRENSMPELKDTIASMLHRWYALGILEDTYLEKFCLSQPRLDEPFSVASQEAKEILQEITPVIAAIEGTQLAKFLYPVSILYGSRIKRYGTRTADLDIALFVRPNVSMEERPQLHELLRQTLTGEKCNGKALEFWLTHDGNNLRIQDFFTNDDSIGDSNLVHVLFEGVWAGDIATIKRMHEKLLTGYLYSKGKRVGKQDARKIWLEEMERDTLQYRLMHKGYSRFFPKQGGIHTKHADKIDSKSIFWDSGYRRLATQLFIRKVFLPQL